MLRRLLLRMLLALPILGQGSSASAQSFDWLGRIALDAEGLQSEDAATRNSAVLQLQRYHIDWTKDYLLEALRDPDVGVRSSAARALAQHKVVEAVPIISTWLGEPDSGSKQEAARLLGELKAKEAVPGLVRALGDMDPAVRTHAVRALGNIGDPSVLVPLVTHLEDDSPEVKKAVVEELARLKDPKAVLPLLGRFDDSSIDVRIAALRAVGELGDTSAVPAVLRHLDSRPDSISIAAITALGQLEAIEAAPHLLERLSKGSGSARSKTAFALGQIARAHPNDRESQRALRTLIASLAESRLRSASREALLAAGQAAVPGLIAQLEGKLEGDPQSSVGLLRQIGDSRAVPALIAELDRGRVPQDTLLGALQELGDKRALVPILGLLDDPTPGVRLQAMRALAPFIDQSPEAADIIADRLGDSSPQVQQLAADYLGRMRASNASGALAALVEGDASPQLRRAALEALGRIGDSSQAGVALRQLKEGPGHMRAIAADALIELAGTPELDELRRMARGAQEQQAALAIDVLAGMARRAPSSKIDQLLLELARGGSGHAALAATTALGALESKRSLELLRELARERLMDQRIAALAALAERGDAGSEGFLASLLDSANQQLAALGAWGLAQLPELEAESLAALWQATRSSSAALSANASAALARHPRQGDLERYHSLLHHRNRLVRNNALLALGKLGATVSQDRVRRLAQEDPSPLVRVAALRSLSIIERESEESRTLFERVRDEDHRSSVRAAAAAALDAAFAPPARSDWAVFRIIDEHRDHRDVPYQGRFFVAADGLASCRRSDARGRIVFENWPEGDFVEGLLDNLERH